MSDSFAPVGCTVEVYPFEGNTANIQGGQIRALTVKKTLRGGASGTFSIDLAPGGPDGPESSPDWTEIITPGSHVLIGLQRGANAALVMNGVVTQSSENTQWQTTDEGSTATRSPNISGADFAWYFNTQNWYNLASQGFILNSALRGQLGLAPAGLVPVLSQGQTGLKTPVLAGQTWFNIMTASGVGMLSQTFVPYKSGNTRLPFSSLFAQNYEQYADVIVPITEQYLGLESWTAKFMDIFPWPWYEFFVTTAPSGIYAFAPSTSPVGPNTVVTGTTFTLDGMPSALPAGPQLVARVNPTPRMNFIEDGLTIAPLDMSRWNVLPLTELSNTGFYESAIRFSSDEARNFYKINPSAYATVLQNGASNTPFGLIFGAAADPASVHRYGYRPADGTLRWFFDPNGIVAEQAQQGGGTFSLVQSVLTVTAMLASQWHPLPLMAEAEVAIPLNPSIYIGTRFRYAPFKDGVTWDFYVEGVTHRYIFGGHSTTVLDLSRGLPSSIYADASPDGLLQAIFTGNARRAYTKGSSAVYQKGLPDGTGQGLQVFSTVQSSYSVVSQMNAFVTPQANGS